MIKAFLTCCALMIAGLSVHAQSNLYVPPGNGSSFRAWPVIESGDQVYYLSDRLDSTASGKRAKSYYFSAVNKHTYTLTRSVLLFRDSVFNMFEGFEKNSITYCFNEATRKFSFFKLTFNDSSLVADSPQHKYPGTISFMQMDASLNVTLPNKPIRGSDAKGRFMITGMGTLESTTTGPLVLSYQVFDSTFETYINWHPHFWAERLIKVNDTGKVLADEFLGKEPKGIDSEYPWSVNRKMCKVGNDEYGAIVLNERVFQQEFSLLILDSALHTVRTYGHPWIGYPASAYFFLPGGALINTVYANVTDSNYQKFYNLNVLTKAEPSAGYQFNKQYNAPALDTGDDSHAVAAEGCVSAYFFGCMVYNPSVYNNYDNRIYTFSSTRSNHAPSFCLNGKPNLGQIVALDTNLSEKWVRYVRPRPNHCIASSSVAATDGRNGVLVSGWEYDLANSSDRRPFIYLIDSSTSLGVANPESPIIITGQFSVYPNPAKDHIVIENVLGTSYTYSIINSLGQNVASGKGQGLNTNVDLERLPFGLYVAVIVAADGQRFSLKFLKR